MVDYSVTIEVYDIKIGKNSKLNEYLEIYMFQRSTSFFDLSVNRNETGSQVSDTGPLVLWFFYYWTIVQWFTLV